MSEFVSLDDTHVLATDYSYYAYYAYYSSMPSSRIPISPLTHTTPTRSMHTTVVLASMHTTVAEGKKNTDKGGVNSLTRDSYPRHLASPCRDVIAPSLGPSRDSAISGIICTSDIAWLLPIPPPSAPSHEGEPPGRSCSAAAGGPSGPLPLPRLCRADR